jgi:hypothetical protein
MKLSHYSVKRIRKIRNAEQPSQPDMKPRGLWLSVDGADDWPEHCRKTKWGPIGERRKVIRYRVELDHSRVLVLDTAASLVRFSDKYARFTLHPRLQAPVEFKLAIWIDWKAVAEKYAGIIIAPYQWVCRIELPWYYPWDCASGCIWDATAVRSIKAIRLSGRRRLPQGA